MIYNILCWCETEETEEKANSRHRVSDKHDAVSKYYPLWFQDSEDFNCQLSSFLL